MKLKLIYDTPFYLYKLEQYKNNILIKEEMNLLDRKIKLSKEHEKDIASQISNKRTVRIDNLNYYYQKQNIKKYIIKNNEKEISDIDVNDNFRDEKEKIKVDKIKKNLLGFILISLIYRLNYFINNIQYFVIIILIIVLIIPFVIC